MLTTERPSTRADRRRVARELCDRGTASLSARLGEALCTATIQNISAHGIGAVVDHEIRTDTLLAIELFNKTRECWHLKVMRVIYATPQGEGSWSIGCSFLGPLTDSEVQELLGRPRGV